MTTFFLDGKTPRRIARTHGVIALAALSLLLIFVADTGSASQIAGLILLFIAAFAGAVLFTRGRKNMELPKWLPVLHGLAAVIGFFMLLISL